MDYQQRTASLILFLHPMFPKSGAEARSDKVKARSDELRRPASKAAGARLGLIMRTY